MLYVFKAPIITWPQEESCITEEMRLQAHLHRLVMMASADKTEEATEFEAMLYIMTSTFANPPAHVWYKIYMHLFCKFYPEKAKDVFGDKDTLPGIHQALNRIANAMEKPSDATVTYHHLLAEGLTKETILQNASIDELWCLFHTFKEYWNEMYSPDVFKPRDDQIGKIVEKLKAAYMAEQDDRLCRYCDKLVPIEGEGGYYCPKKKKYQNAKLCPDYGDVRKKPQPHF